MEDPDVCAYFAALGLDTHQVSNLFLLLDQDESGTLTREEFLKGVLRLRGGAKSVDMAILMYELERVHDHMNDVVESLRHDRP
mmetsp:Transcript_127834/g.272625  ORF Transcript_127834/g.272625 Transcript_127834/m.272625 type:complete len:83 (-) Transcript_127834:84-332(-)